MTRDEHLRRELERLFREWSVRTAPIGALIFLLIAPLDFIGVPELAARFLAYRVAAAAGLLLVWRLAPGPAPRSRCAPGSWPASWSRAARSRS